MPPKRLIFQLGTNNWQRQNEPAPGSGILHEAHHNAYNAMPDTVCYSIFPSSKQTQATPEEKDMHFRVFELSHDIPVAESASPVSKFRWHAMSDADFAAYRKRLGDEVYDLMQVAEKEQQTNFTLVIAHHAFLNPLVMRDVLRRRAKEGKPPCPLFVFVHGTTLKMYVHEINGKDQKDFPMRFHKMMLKENIFGDGSVAGAFAISTDQQKKMKEIFPMFPVDRMVISPNGVNQSIFRPLDTKISSLLQEHRPMWPAKPVLSPRARGYKHMVVFVGKYADWKRLDAVLRAAKLWEAHTNGTVCTAVIGTGVPEDVHTYHTLAARLDLQHTYLLGPKSQPELAAFFSAGNVGVFPSYSEPFGMVFIECMACGTPVIGANSGGPKDFVSSEVGTLIDEPADRFDWPVLEKAVHDAVMKALKEDWKKTKRAACLKLADGYTVVKQCSDLLAGVDRLVSSQAKPGA